MFFFFVFLLNSGSRLIHLVNRWYSSRYYSTLPQSSFNPESSVWTSAGAGLQLSHQILCRSSWGLSSRQQHLTGEQSWAAKELQYLDPPPRLMEANGNLCPNIFSYNSFLFACLEVRRPLLLVKNACRNTPGPNLLHWPMSRGIKRPV